MSARLLEGEVGPSLIRMAVPMFWGMLAVTSFTIVDSFYIGQLGAMPLAAMGFTFPVVFVVQCVAMGMSVATSSILSRTIGQGDQAKVRRIATDSLLLSLVAVLAISSIGLATIDPVFRLLGATPELIDMIREFMTVWYPGAALLVVPMVGNSAIRATGDATSPSLIMIVAGVANLILDPFLIFGWGPFPRMELRGAALATVISWMFAFAASAWFLTRRLHLIEFRKPAVREVLQSWRTLLRVGLPAIGTNLMMPLASGMLTRLLSGYGTEAVAAFGVGMRLEAMAMAGGFSLSTVLSPFVGQNIGGKRVARVVEAVRKAAVYAFVWGGFVCVLYALGARTLAGLFTDHPEVIRLTALYLWIVPVSYGAHGAAAQVTAMFNAFQQPLRSSSIFVLRLFVFTLPLAFLGSHLMGVAGIFAGISVSNFLVAVVAALMARQALRRLRASGLG